MSRFRSSLGSIIVLALTSCSLAAAATYEKVRDTFASAYSYTIRIVDRAIEFLANAVSPKSPAVMWVRAQAYKLGLQRRERPRMFSAWRMVPST